MTHPLSRRGLSWGCHLGMFMFGVTLALLGALLPFLFEKVRLHPSQAGSLFLFLNLGALLVTVASGPIFDRFGFKTMLTVASFLSSGSFFLMSGAEAYETFAASSFLLGLGGGVLNVGTNALVADLYAERRAAALSILGIFFGFGAFFIPLFTGTLLEALSMKGILRVTGGLALVPGILFLLFSFPPAKQAAGFALQEALAFLRRPLVLLMGILLFFESGTEITSSGWISTYLVQSLGLSAPRAALYLAGFWGFVMMGRFCSSRLVGRIGEARLVQWSALSAGAAMLLFIVLPDPFLSALTGCWAGFSLAAIFPAVLGQAAGRFPEFSGTVFGILMSLALVGGMTLPWMTGYLAGQRSLGTGLLVAVLGFLMVFILQTIIRVRLAKPPTEGVMPACESRYGR